MNILVAPNDYYVMPTIVLLQSLFEAVEEAPDIYCIYSELADENINRLKNFISEHGGVLHLIEIDSAIFAAVHTSVHITKEAYYRLVAQEVLPDDVDKVLYLDSDIVVTKSLEKLYHMSFTDCDGKENYFVVCEGTGVSQKQWDIYDSLKIPRDRLYFNSGVLLVNLRLLREKFDLQRFFDVINEHNDKLVYHDQDVLNALFYDDVIYADWHIYNQTALHIENKKEADERLKYAAVIHYAGSDKPWKYDYKSYYYSLFWKFARRAGYRKEFLVNQWKRFWWHIKNRLQG